MKNIIEKPFSYHKNTLKNANIIMSDKWIKNQLQKWEKKNFHQKKYIYLKFVR